MLKTIAAALLAASVLAAPAMAAGYGRTAHAPFIMSGQVNQSMLNANARMGRHHHYNNHRHHYHHRHFRHHHRFHNHR